MAIELTIFRRDDGNVALLLRHAAEWLEQKRIGRRLVDITWGWEDDQRTHLYVYTLPAPQPEKASSEQ